MIKSSRAMENLQYVCLRERSQSEKAADGGSNCKTFWKSQSCGDGIQEREGRSGSAQGCLGQ
jgi:hypothetical protein